MTDSLKILFIEDRPEDLEIEWRELRGAGIPFESKVVDHVADLGPAILSFRPDLILSDFSVPGGNGLDSLRIAKELSPSTPFIFVSGTIGEEAAVASLKQGATDYVLKDRMVALPDRVKRAITDVKEKEERRRLEEQLSHIQRVEAVGQLAGGVAHDFNNVLTVLTGYLEMSLAKLSSDHPVGTYLEEARKATEYATYLTRQLLAFSRKQVLKPSVCDLNDTAIDMVDMLRRLVGESISLSLKPDPGLWKVRVDIGRIQQVLMNLVLNARDALGAEGTITLATENRSVDAAFAAGHEELRVGDYACLTVTDTGVGMDRETLARVFEPFYTTKKKGKGTGLGLSTAIGVVKQSGGHIWAESEPGKGSTFHVLIPRCFEAPPDEAQSDRASAPTRPCRVLLVEDSASVRSLTRRILEVHGHSVEDAESAEVAARILVGAKERFDLLISDVILPGAGRPDLAAQARHHHPGIGVIFMSGYGPEDVREKVDLSTGDAFLHKPFTPEALVECMARVLSARNS